MKTAALLAALALALVAIVGADGYEPFNLTTPFNKTISMGRLDDVLLRFDVVNSSRLTPRVTTTLTDKKHTLNVLVSDPCVSTAYTLPAFSAKKSGCLNMRDSRPVCQNQCGRGRFALSLNTFAEQLNVSVAVELEDIALVLDEPKTVSVRSWSPAFLRFDFAPYDMDSVSFQVRSSSSAVATVSIQNESCPVFDMPDNVDFTVSRVCLLRAR